MTTQKNIPVTMNVDRIIRRKDFVDVPGLRVTSMFRTIQGEGPYAGYPAVFVRLAGCNFGDKSDRCRWCDTDFRFDAGTTYEIPDLMDLLVSLQGYSSKDILVVTGGEPLLQENVVHLINEARNYFANVQIETNGTQGYIMESLPSREHCHVVVSPKASLKLGGYAQLSAAVLARADSLKFVVSADPTDPHHEVPSWAFEADVPLLYVSPMAVYKRAYSGEVSSIWDDTLVDREATAANYAYAAKYAMDNHTLLSLQTHLFTAIP